MTEDNLYLLLKPLAGGQVYPYVAPLGSDGQPSISPPWVIFSLISDVTADVLCGQAESGITLSTARMKHGKSRNPRRKVSDGACAPHGAHALRTSADHDSKRASDVD